MLDWLDLGQRNSRRFLGTSYGYADFWLVYHLLAEKPADVTDIYKALQGILLLRKELLLSWWSNPLAPIMIQVDRSLAADRYKHLSTTGILIS